MKKIQSKGKKEEIRYLKKIMGKLLETLEKKSIKLDISFEGGDGINLKVTKNGIFQFDQATISWIKIMHFDTENKNIIIPINKKKNFFDTLSWIIGQGCKIEKKL